MARVLLLLLVATTLACGSKGVGYGGPDDGADLGPDRLSNGVDGGADIATDLPLDNASSPSDTTSDSPGELLSPTDTVNETSAPGLLDADDETAASDLLADAADMTPELPGTEDVLDAACTPDCEGKTCGDDGCGGACGTCGCGPYACINLMIADFMEHGCAADAWCFDGTFGGLFSFEILCTEAACEDYIEQSEEQALIWTAACTSCGY